MLLVQQGEKTFSDLRQSDLNKILGMVKLRGQEFAADNFSVTVRNDNSIKFRVRKDGQSMEATLHRTWVFYFEEPQAGLYWDVTPADNAAEVLFLALQMGYRLSA